MVTDGKRLLMAEPDRDLSAGCALLLGRDGYTVVVAHDGAQAWTRMATEPFDLLLLSERIGRVDWPRLLDQASALKVPTLLLRRTPVRLRQLLEPSLPAGVLPLPFEYPELRSSVEEILALRESEDVITAGDYTVRAADLTLGGARITWNEWRVLRALDALEPQEGDRVYLDALNQKLSRLSSPWEIRWQDGYRWVRKS